VTLKFIAELPFDAIAPLGDALATLVAGERAPAPCAMRLDAFPRLDHARVVVIELRDEGGAIGQLAKRIDELTYEQGVPREERAFRPHVTLARLKRPYDARRWARPELAEGAGACSLVGVTLFQSTLGSEGATHTALASARFRA
jgi:2'-5' RNA ligase